MGDLETGLLEWSSRQAAWQRDLLRRIAGGEMLTAADYRAYADEANRIELSKDADWFKEPELDGAPSFTPLDASHLAATVVGGDPVQVTKIAHLEGVNNLAAGAELDFKPTGLTIIAGSNGTGKSGYTRIFKQVAATRASEQVLTNAFNPVVEPKAIVTYQVGDGASTTDLTWNGGATKDESPMQRVRVFDSRSANVHLAGATEVAYVPASLQVLGAYTNALQEVAALIESDARDERLQAQRWPALESGIGLTLLEGLGTPEAREALTSVKPLSDEEKKELEDLPGRIAELSTSDPATRAVQARQRAEQLATFANSLESIAQKLTTVRIDEFKRVRDELASARTAVNQAQKLFDGADVLPDTGSHAWRVMWSAAQDFTESVDHGHDYPEECEQCPLCAQSLDTEAKRRFELFFEFMNNEAQATLVTAHNRRDTDVQVLTGLPLSTTVTKELVELVETYDKEVGSSLLGLIEGAVAWRDALIADTDPEGVELRDPEVLGENFTHTIKALRKAAKSEENAAKKLAEADGSALAVTKLTSRRDALTLRAGIYSARGAIGAQHDRVLRAARFDEAKATCATSSASRKNSKLSQGYVTKVCAQFEVEATRLGLQRVPVELAFDRTSKGVSYVKVQLKGASQIPVSSVLSEGEQRVTAIAGFLADLTESGDMSALVFDDPVSSLDQEYRVKVAQRLLAEAEQRQVLVFTHDFSFVQYLYEEKTLRDKKRGAAGEEIAADLEYRHIARTPSGAGTVTDAEVWRHVSTKERIGRLKSRTQAVAALYRNGDLIAYEKEARDIVGAVRETWEVFVEQELLNGVVRRHERSVQTQRLAKLTDLTSKDIARVDLGMTVESRYMTGHAAPLNDGSPPQEPSWLMEEIRGLEELRKEVIARR